jgi:putative transposase
MNNVYKYLANQEEHNRKKKFKEEYTYFFNIFEIEYKDEFIFEWLD